ncbi:CBS domain-containing protein [Emticicia sp. CRIBPO]|jgi:CBS domain-containing protein|uniref:CBS domain-containing protein n=1 Tax=Emticicia sp. CRIBPO TaxID=2683258 RepID=UPI00197AE87F|nr:CBS domain-containing protein [Emticicia sp. CRIBPO]
MATSVKTLLANKKIKSLLSVTPSTTVYDALIIMSENNIGALLVMEDQKLVGIFSERDYARKGIIKGRKANTTSISEVMTPNVYTVNPGMNIVECMEIMSSRKFRHLPVVDHDTVIGILSVGDIVTALIIEQKTHINFLESYISG